MNKKKIKTKKRIKSFSIIKFLKSKFLNFFSNPLNKLVFKFSGLIFIFYALWISSFFQEHIVGNTAIFYAKISGFILKLFNYPVLVSGDSLGANSFSISIKNGCDAIEAIAILFCGILVYPSTKMSKLKGIFYGLIILALLNIIRILSLFFIGIYIQPMFEIMHTGVWQVLFIIFPIIIIFVWVNRNTSKQLITD